MIFPKNDDVIAYGRTNSLGNQYNDILLNYLRDTYGVTTGTLPDLLYRYSGTYPEWTFTRNLLSYTETFETTASASYWTNTNVTVTNNTSIDPNSTTLADTVLETATTAAHHVQKTSLLTNVPVGTTYTSSIYAKQGVGTRFLQIVGAGTAFGSGVFSVFNLQTGTATAGVQTGAGGVSITSVGNGWYRCSFTMTTSVLGAITVSYRMTNNNTAVFSSYLGDGTSTLLFWGAQFELDTLTTYQPVLTT